MNKPTANQWIFPALLVLISLCLGACGGSDSGTSDPIASEPPSAHSEAADAQEDFAEAMGAGQGGGTLVFDGTSYAIESAICHLDPPVEVGTVGEGYRVMIDGGQRPRASIVDPESVHWTHVDWQTVNFTVSGSTITGIATSYRNNVDERVVEASFEIECP